MNYEVQTKKISGSSFKLCVDEGIVLYPRLENFEIKKLTLYDNKLIEYTLTKKFMNKYKKMLNMLISTDVTDDEGFEALLGEVQKMEDIILRKYKKHMKIEKTKRMLKELLMLEQEIKKKKSYTIVYNKEDNKVTNKSR